MPLAQLPVQRVVEEVAVPGEKVDSSHSSFEVEIDQFRFVQEGEISTRPIELSNSGSDLDRLSAANPTSLVIAQIDMSQELKKADIDLKSRSRLRGLMSNRNKGQSSKDAPNKQVLAKIPPLPPPSSIDLALQPIPNLRRKRPVEELEEGKVGP